MAQLYTTEITLEVAVLCLNSVMIPFVVFVLCELIDCIAEERKKWRVFCCFWSVLFL